MPSYAAAQQSSGWGSAPLHGRLDAAQELARPQNVAGYARRVARQRRRRLVPLVLRLHVGQVARVCRQHARILGLQVGLPTLMSRLPLTNVYQERL